MAKPPAIPLILQQLLGQGCRFRIQHGLLYLTPSKVDPPSEGQKELVRAAKERIVEYIAGGHLKAVYCEACHRWRDEKRACWHCVDRVCKCGRLTGSAFIELCSACGIDYEGKETI